jgi:hypothetical protein
VIAGVNWMLAFKVLQPLVREKLDGDIRRNSKMELCAPALYARVGEINTCSIFTPPRVLPKQRNRLRVRGIQSAVAVDRHAQREIGLVLEAVTQLGQLEVLHPVAVIRAIHAIPRRQRIAADGSIAIGTKQRQPDVEAIADQQKPRRIGCARKAVSRLGNARSTLALLLWFHNQSRNIHPSQTRCIPANNNAIITSKILTIHLFHVDLSLFE